MVDTVCSQKPFIRVGGDEKPAEVVKSRLLKLDSEHIQFVLDCMRNNTTKIRNIRQYLLAALYNAPMNHQQLLSVAGQPWLIRRRFLNWKFGSGSGWFHLSCHFLYPEIKTKGGMWLQDEINSKVVALSIRLAETGTRMTAAICPREWTGKTAEGTENCPTSTASWQADRRAAHEAEHRTYQHWDHGSEHQILWAHCPKIRDRFCVEEG